jgi:hypothetical protein
LTGVKPTTFDVDCMLRRSYGDQDSQESNEGLTLLELTRIFLPKLLARANNEVEVFHEAFNAIDASKRGFLTLEDFDRAVLKAVPHISRAAVKLAFHDANVESGQSLVSYREFLRIMNDKDSSEALDR